MATVLLTEVTPSTNEQSAPRSPQQLFTLFAAFARYPMQRRRLSEINMGDRSLLLPTAVMANLESDFVT